MEKFETSYRPMELPPMAAQNNFVVMVEWGHGSLVKVLPKVYHNYNEAMHARVNLPGQTDCFLRGFDTEGEAQRWINCHIRLE